jgi:proteasome accessory factor B
VIDRLERLLNLVIALRETRRPLPAGEIRERVAGYGQSDPEAFRRMFERDKADLRALGVPVETAPLDRFDDRTGYRIDPAAYDLPPVNLEPGELAALALALAATGLAEDARAGLTKLAVATALDGEQEPDAGTALPPPVLAVALDAPHRRELMEAQLTRTPVRFRYRPLAGETQLRRVDPHALVHRRGFWYLVGHDHDRNARRAFRLDRIAGTVATAGEPGSFPPAADVGVDDVVPRLPGTGPEQVEVAAAAGVAWVVARRALGGGRPELGTDGVATGRSRFTITVDDPEAFLRWVLEFGPEVEVMGPPALRRGAAERLSAVRDAATA